MDYITAAEAAEKWGVSQRQVHRLLAANRITGVKQYGKRFFLSGGRVKNLVDEICEKLFLSGRNRRKELAKYVL